MGIGQASGDDRAVSAAKAAISSPLLEAAIDGARGVLLNITGPSSMGLFEMNAAAEIIHGVAHADANIIFGTVIDDEMGDEVKVTVIAAGFDRLDGPVAGRRPKPPTLDHRAVRRGRGRSARRRRRRRLRRPVVPALTRRRPRRRATSTRSAARIAAAGGGDDVELAGRHQGLRARGRRRPRPPPGCRRSARTTPRSCWPSADGAPTPALAVHFIGRLQSNKVRLLAGLVDVWETRRPAVARRRDRPAGARARRCSSRSTPPASRARAAARRTTSPALVERAARGRARRRRADDGRADGRRPGGGPPGVPRRAPAGRRARPARRARWG